MLIAWSTTNVAVLETLHRCFRWKSLITSIRSTCRMKGVITISSNTQAVETYSKRIRRYFVDSCIHRTYVVPPLLLQNQQSLTISASKLEGCLSIIHEYGSTHQTYCISRVLISFDRGFNHSCSRCGWLSMHQCQRRDPSFHSFDLFGCICLFEFPQ